MLMDGTKLQPNEMDYNQITPLSLKNVSEILKDTDGHADYLSNTFICCFKSVILNQGARFFQVWHSVLHNIECKHLHMIYKRSWTDFKYEFIVSKAFWLFLVFLNSL